MCRMVGTVFRGQFPAGVLEDLRLVSRDGAIPGRAQPGHRDGWGIVTFLDGAPAYLGRSTKWAADDPSYETAVGRAAVLRPPSILVAHVRAASRGTAKLVNTHPFIAGDIALCHNGTIKGFNPETERKPRGETDSELIALVVAERYEKVHDLRAALKSVIREEVIGRKFTGAVLVASDGKTLCGYRDYSENQDYYDLRIAASKDKVVLFQETASGIDGSVSRVKRQELVSVGLDLKIKREAIR